MLPKAPEREGGGAQLLPGTLASPVDPAEAAVDFPDLEASEALCPFLPAAFAPRPPPLAPPAALTPDLGADPAFSWSLPLSLSASAIADSLEAAAAALARFGLSIQCYSQNVAL